MDVELYSSTLLYSAPERSTSLQLYSALQTTLYILYTLPQGALAVAHPWSSASSYLSSQSLSDSRCNLRATSRSSHSRPESRAGVLQCLQNSFCKCAVVPAAHMCCMLLATFTLTAAPRLAAAGAPTRAAVRLSGGSAAQLRLWTSGS